MLHGFARDAGKIRELQGHYNPLKAGPSSTFSGHSPSLAFRLAFDCA